jgi:DNA-directed RNA polymerase subunit M/transcription elongation factor TFIIS
MEVREKTLQTIANRCDFLSEPLRKDLEKGIFNSSIDDAKRRNIYCVWENPDFLTIYKGIARRTIMNLDTNSYVGNSRLKGRLLEGEFKPHDVPYMTYNELYPEKWHDMLEMALKRETKMLDVDKSMATDMFKCTRCGKRQCTYYEMQTRSADEPMTQFIRCLNCGKQWRQ